MLVSAGILLIRNVTSSPEILLLRSAECYSWGPPKGHLEAKENPIEAALRETFEETGITLDQIELLDGFQELVSYYSRSKRFKTVAYYLGTLSDVEAKIHLSKEHCEFIWTSLSDALQLLDSDILQNLLRTAFAHYKTRALMH